MIVLEIGCGTSEFSRLLAQRFKQVIAIDLSPKMIEVAQQRSQGFNNINFQVADILQWQFSQEKFDAIAQCQASPDRLYSNSSSFTIRNFIT